MKRPAPKLIMPLMSLLLLAGCAPSATVDGAGFTAVPASSGTYEVGVPSTEQDAGSETASTETPNPEGEKSFVITNISSAPLQTELIKSVTIREKYSEVDGAVHTTFKNHEIDFSELIITVDELVCKESGTSIGLTVVFPEEWTNAEIHSIGLYLSFRFSTEQRELADFRMLSQDPLPSMSHTEERVDSINYRFHSATLTPSKLSGNERLYITPIVHYKESLSGSFANGRAGDEVMLLEGDSCTYDGTELDYSGIIRWYGLNELRLEMTLPEWIASAEIQPEQKKENILPVTNWEEDWERNEELGYYGNYAPFYYGTVYNTSADFSEFEFCLESVRVWDGGLYIVLRVTVPPSWDQATVNAVVGGGEIKSFIQTLIQTDESVQSLRPSSIMPSPYRKFSISGSFITGTPIRSYLNQSFDRPREYYVICEENTRNLWAIEQTETLDFLLWYYYYETLEFDNEILDLTGGERFYVDEADDSNSRIQITLRQITISASEIIGYKEILG
ncbi:MAG: hypothetical protein Q4C01_06930 [Clostridia bacterium]|nr:hypothetical protein [Clostridia bacterium]